MTSFINFKQSMKYWFSKKVAIIHLFYDCILSLSVSAYDCLNIIVNKKNWHFYKYLNVNVHWYIRRLEALYIHVLLWTFLAFETNAHLSFDNLAFFYPKQYNKYICYIIQYPTVVNKYHTGLFSLCSGLKPKRQPFSQTWSKCKMCFR